MFGWFFSKKYSFADMAIGWYIVIPVLLGVCGYYTTDGFWGVLGNVLGRSGEQMLQNLDEPAQVYYGQDAEVNNRHKKPAQPGNL